MSRLIQAIKEMLVRLSVAVLRFPLSVISLIGATALICYMISLDVSPSLFVQKLTFTFVVAAFLGVTAQFACERFPRLNSMRPGVYLVAVLLAVGYYFIIAPVPAIDYDVGARTSVAVFSLFCAFVWLPSFREDADFNSVALVHFKSAAIAGLYAGVLAVGLAAIIGAVDILLFDVNGDTYGYMMAIVWVLFAPLYFLALLPRFNSTDSEDRFIAEEAYNYPKFLEILVSYIAVPLVTAFTLVLFFYFIKIAVTRVWPIGQLGPMVLGYSSAGLVIYILASRLENRFAVLYQLIFPKVLVPVVVMQLVSVYIRLNAYGFTESRYYVALFGVFSIVIGLVLSVKPVKRNGLIALLAAGFAIFSIVPPLDAFTVSRNSQVNRITNILQEAEILEDGKITPRDDADLEVRLETTSILQYLEYRKYLDDLSWIPDDFETYRDMKEVFGFEPTYPQVKGNEDFFFAGLDMQTPLSIEGYDVLLRADVYWEKTIEGEQKPVTFEFQVQGEDYRVVIERVSHQEARVAVQNAAGEELVATGLYDFASSLSRISDEAKEIRDVDSMTFDVEGKDTRLRIIFQTININLGTDTEAWATNYDMFILVDAPAATQ